MCKPKSFTSSLVIALALSWLPLLSTRAATNDQAAAARFLSLYFSGPTNKRNDAKPANKPINATALRNAVKVAAGSSTERLRKDLMKLIVAQINLKGLSFAPTEEDTAALREAGATDEVIAAVESKGREYASQIEAEAWQACANSQQAEPIKAFLDQYPDSRFAENARARLEALHWAQTQNSQQVEEVAQFVAAYPNSERVAQAQAQIELLAWQKAQADATVESFLGFTQAYPQSAFVKSAQQRLAQLEWEEIKHTADLAAFSAFLETYPEGTLAEAARIRIEQLRWQTTLAGGKAKDFEEYLRRYPTGHFASAARQRLNRLTDPDKYFAKSEDARPLEITEAELRRYVVKEVAPPPLATGARGKFVKVRIVLSAGGTIQLVEAIDGARALREDAVKLVQQWQFRPVEQQGKPVPVESVLTVPFSAVSPKAEQP